MKLCAFAILAAACPLLALDLRAEEIPAPDFSAVFRIFDERCIECHSTEETEGGLVLESHEALVKGGETGKSIEPGKSAESLLMKYLRGEVEKEGKKRFMPPGKREKLAPEEIQLIARWIDAGAKPPVAGAEKPREIQVPKVAPKVAPRNAVHALAYSPAAKLIAVGRYGVVELLADDTRALVRRLDGLKGNVNALTFSPDGAHLFAASGENGVHGEVKHWRVADGELIRTITGHRDTLYALALSPDGKTLATGSYDQQIKLWNAETGTEMKTLRGHNGAVFALGFRADGKLLASASADRTVKLWDVVSGQRRDTLSQPTKEQVTLAWSADGKRLAAGGFDNRIRIWEVSAEAKETTNPLRHTVYAHEGPILRIIWSTDGATLLTSAQDATVKLWHAGEVKERLLLEKQPDWPAALAFIGDGRTVLAGRLDGSLACYDAAGQRVAAAAPKRDSKPAAPPTLTRLEPRGVQRGGEEKVKLIGKGLAELKAVKSTHPDVTADLIAGAASDGETWVLIKAPANLPRGAYDLTVVNASGQESAAVKVHIDDLPVYDADEEKLTILSEPTATIWGTLEKGGDSDRVEFEARNGQTFIFDVSAKSLGSKADVVLNIVDPLGRVLASNNDFDGSADPFIAHTFKATGEYALVVTDLQFGGSDEHFYRVSVGELPYVTGCYPLSVPAKSETEVELIGHNLPADARVKVKAEAGGEVALPLDADKFRSRRGLKVLVSDLPQTREMEPNDEPVQATAMAAPGSAEGRLVPTEARVGMPVAQPTSAPEGSASRREEQRHVPQAPVTQPLAPVVPGAPRPPAAPAGTDADLFRFEAKRGSVWVIETQAAQRGTPVDTKIELLHPDGQPIERLLMQAVRDSAITFRAIDSTTADARVENWEEMQLNQWLYLGGEVAKLFRMPEGPDSGFQFYTTNGQRTAYFNTTPTAHSLDEPCYIVEPHPPGAKLIANGLPVFPLLFANDDDGDRKLGTDSRLLFTAPADGAYLVRVSDSRGLGGERFVYRLVVREAKPDFSVSLALASQTLNAGSGQGFTVTADRKDGFEGEVAVEIAGVPEGYKASTPLVIEAGHQTAKGTLNALPGAKQLPDAEWGKVKVTASALVGSQRTTREVNGFGKVSLGKEPQVFVALEPAAAGDTLQRLSAATPLQAQDPTKPFEITIAPGETIPAWIKVTRAGHTAELRFDVENLPHGVIVDNLGLNGITLLTGQSEGEIAIKADPWVQEMDRLCHAVTREAGKQTSLPVLLHVRKKAAGNVTAAKGIEP